MLIGRWVGKDKIRASVLLPGCWVCEQGGDISSKCGLGCDKRNGVWQVWEVNGQFYQVL